MKRSYCLLILLVFGVPACSRLPVTSPVKYFELEVSPGVSVPVRTWPVESGKRILWLSSDRGFPEGMQQLAAQLQARGMEIWQADMLAADFLPSLPSSLAKVSDSQLLALMKQVLQRDQRPLVLMADGHGAKLVMRMAQAWRNQHSGQWPKKVKAVLLISPNLYQETPSAGTEARYIDSAGAAGGRHEIFQPQLSPYYWWLRRTREQLEKRGGKVVETVLPGVRDRFYFRPDATDREQQQAERFGQLIADRVNRKNDD